MEFCISILPPTKDASVHCLLFRENKTDWTRFNGSLYKINFTRYDKDNEREWSMLRKLFSLWFWGPWMNHLPPVWWSTFRFVFINDSWYVIWYCGYIFILMFCFQTCLIFYQNFTTQINVALKIHFCTKYLYYHIPKTCMCDFHISIMKHGMTLI